MSATNRGSEREENDGYYTPLPLARAAIRRLIADDVLSRDQHRYILEPSVGRGAWASASVLLLDPDQVDGVDIVEHPEALVTCDFHKQDFLQYDPDECYDLIIGNPPYEGAERHIRHSMTMLDHNGALVQLLRINFLGGVERCNGADPTAEPDPKYPPKGLWAIHRPNYVYVLNRRPPFKKVRRQKRDPKTKELVFNNDGTPKMTSSSSDATEYGIFVWIEGTQPEDTIQRTLCWSMKE